MTFGLFNAGVADPCTPFLSGPRFGSQPWCVRFIIEKYRFTGRVSETCSEMKLRSIRLRGPKNEWEVQEG